MTEEEWKRVRDPEKLLEVLHTLDCTRSRKMRLLSFATCRAVRTQLLEDFHRDSIEVAERHADGQATDEEFRYAVSLLHRVRRKGNSLDKTVYDAVRWPKGSEYVFSAGVIDGIARAAASCAAPDPSPTSRSYFIGDRMVRERPAPNNDRLVWNATFAEFRKNSRQLIKDIFGNPFRPVSFDPAWRTSTVVALAQPMYDSRDFSAMPILGDALEDAGCEHADILDHCRCAGPHVRGCWVVDLILGKE